MSGASHVCPVCLVYRLLKLKVKMSVFGLQVIRISGYIADEKVAIARRYLEPQCQKLTGVPADGITITDDAMYTLITEYAR